MNFDDIFDEFVAFQLLASSDIPQSVSESAKEKMENDYQEFVRMDKIWAFLSTMKTGDGYNLRLPQLSKVAKLVLTLPHSNAGEERAFILVHLNTRRSVEHGTRALTALG